MAALKPLGKNDVLLGDGARCCVGCPNPGVHSVDRLFLRSEGLLAIQFYVAEVNVN
jgi:hypothetical protein